jgi:DUF1680 family protein
LPPVCRQGHNRWVCPDRTCSASLQSKLLLRVAVDHVEGIIQMTSTITLLLSGVLAMGSTSAPSASIEPVPYAVPARLTDAAQVLSPARIQLGGWLGARIAANEQNRLLTVDTEPLLAGYRKRPGSHPWIGEHVGKWLHAATLAWANTDDQALRAKLDRVAADLISCQEGDGYLGTYAPEKRFGLYEGADWDVWSHKYNMIGLLTYYQYTGHQPALECCRKMADLLIATFPAKKSLLAAGTHVGMAATSVLEPVVLLYRFTGDSRYLDFAKYIVKCWDEPRGPAILASLRAGKGVNRTANGKAYEMLSNLVGVCELARATGDRSLLEPVLNAWKDIVPNRLYLTGSASSGEHFQGDHVLPGGVGAHICETCVTTTWIQLNLQLLRLTGEAKFGDELERTFYNHLSAAQNPRGDDWCYFTPLEGKKPYDAGINCCHSSGPRGMALAVQAAYLKGKTNAGDDALLVSTFENSKVELELSGQRVVVTQQSEFPRAGTGTLSLHMPKPVKFALLIRVPWWAGAQMQPSSFKVAVNGQADVTATSPGFVAVQTREWKDGDRVELSYLLGPAELAGAFGNQGEEALLWGPFVLAFDQSRNPGLPPAGALGVAPTQTPFELVPGPDLAFRARVVGRRAGESRPAIFVPFADAGATGGVYRVWLRAQGVEPPRNASVLVDGQESRSREGNQNGSINDGDPETFVVTFDGKRAAEDWYAVTLPRAERISRVVFMPGQTFHDGGWFDSRGGKPTVQVQRIQGGPWETVAELPAYPATTATDSKGLIPMQSFEARLANPISVVGVRVVGVPASGNNPAQAFSSCAELRAFVE